MSSAVEIEISRIRPLSRAGLPSRNKIRSCRCFGFSTPRFGFPSHELLGKPTSRVQRMFELELD
ncbi:hypothetical protein KFK09_004433 [Dendrobium nobile]|uniref:Uncharacterized protein n=1 Tax=Dendrobium nobile TaxID=94219 RepID=A0A8T3C2T6_DENNO|nr:hypothetical protein KFK09_004433 [Dendrobium nobile]